MPGKYYIGDVVELKKQHPCGNKNWEVLRVGADFRIQCKGCSHQLMISRVKFEKSVKKIVERKHKEEASES